LDFRLSKFSRILENSKKGIPAFRPTINPWMNDEKQILRIGMKFKTLELSVVCARD
jgi:hypothetical protein